MGRMGCVIDETKDESYCLALADSLLVIGGWQRWIRRGAQLAEWNVT